MDTNPILLIELVIPALLILLGVDLLQHTSKWQRVIIGLVATLLGIYAGVTILAQGSLGIELVDDGAKLLYERFGIVGAVVFVAVVLANGVARISGHPRLKRHVHKLMFVLIFINLYTFLTPILLARFSSDHLVNTGIILGASYLLWKQTGPYSFRDLFEELMT